MSVKRILIIDDEPSIRHVIQLTLETMADWEVLTASSGREGLVIAKAEQPDAILLDIMMPDVDGTATLANLQASKSTQHIPVFLLTAKVRFGDEQAFKHSGATAVIAKPFNPLTLAAEIAKTLGWKL
ncbi:MAG: response regulator [Kastovskya adunca ATA6-11-RM4]|jgi:CheY-like chemotaxis protein|nr:response regulator [Kastovskya adunca ATA6-11-RM4]